MAWPFNQLGRRLSIWFDKDSERKIFGVARDQELALAAAKADRNDRRPYLRGRGFGCLTDGQVQRYHGRIAEIDDAVC